LGIRGVEACEVEGDKREDEESLFRTRPEIEEREQRNGEKPGQERRAQAAVMITTPQNREDEILDRDDRQRVVPAGPFQRERKGPEDGDLAREDPKRVIRH